MSIYSGFSTRQQESQYNSLIERLLNLLQYRVKATINNLEVNEYTWGKKFAAVYRSMVELEFHKYLDPKFSRSCKDIARHYYPSPTRKLANYPSIGRYLTDPRRSNNNDKQSHVLKRSQKETPEKKYNYYGRIMNTFLENGRKSQPPGKVRRRLDLNRHEFWLIDDKIEIMK